MYSILKHCYDALKCNNGYLALQKAAHSNLIPKILLIQGSSIATKNLNLTLSQPTETSDTTFFDSAFNSNLH
jgi:hypothetical protein